MSGLPPVFVVTGGCGFIGANLAATLQHTVPGCYVIAIDSMRTGCYSNLIDACGRVAGEPFLGEVIPESAADIEWAGFMVERKPSVVFHLGAITDTTVDDQSDMLSENSGEAWRYMLDIAADAAVPLVYASSAATYGTPEEAHSRVPFKESSAGRPENVYGFSKWMMETAHSRVQEERLAAGSAKPWIIGLRYFNVFGPGETAKGKMASMPCQLAHQILSGKRPKLFADGSQSRDQVPVEDVVGLTMAAGGIGGAAQPTPGVYNTGSGKATSFEEVAEAVRRGLGVDSTTFATEYFEMPESIARFYQSFTQADMSNAANGLRYTPKHDPVDMISKYASYLAERHSTDAASR